jgi:hypothetical protein
MARVNTVPVAIAAGLLLLVPLALAALAIPRFIDGLLIARVRTVLVDRLYERSIPAPTASKTAALLSGFVSPDGEMKLWQAELEGVSAATDPARLARAHADALEGLKYEPASPRGWTLLCELDVNLHSPDAGTCMNTAFYIGPFDWFVSRRRSVLAAFLWPALDADTRAAAARRLHIMWETDIGGYPHMRDVLYDVARTQHGLQNINQAFVGDPMATYLVRRQFIMRRRSSADSYAPP